MVYAEHLNFSGCPEFWYLRVSIWPAPSKNLRCWDSKVQHVAGRNQLVPERTLGLLSMVSSRHQLLHLFPLWLCFVSYTVINLTWKNDHVLSLLSSLKDQWTRGGLSWEPLTQRNSSRKFQMERREILSSSMSDGHCVWSYSMGGKDVVDPGFEIKQSHYRFCTLNHYFTLFTPLYIYLY